MAQIYNLGVILSQEGENSQILLDRAYYIRKGSEHLFWQAPEAENQEDYLLKWAQATQKGTAPFQVISGLGEKQSAARVFEGNLANPLANPNSKTGPEKKYQRAFPIEYRAQKSFQQDCCRSKLIRKEKNGWK